MDICNMSEEDCVEKICRGFLERNRRKIRLPSAEGVTYSSEHVDQCMRRYKAKIRRKRQKELQQLYRLHDL